jgi:indolepyruvate ferredoxin oxidoreductase alpha subunit
MRRVEKKLKKRFVHSGDIGCYTLGFYPPVNGMDTCICMGASIGMAQGIAKFEDGVAVALIGDSTFYHSGLAGLINAVYNRNNLLIIILDNLSTCMTGHQDHPGTGVLINSEVGIQIPVEDVVAGVVGAANVRVVDAYNTEEVEGALTEYIEREGVRVLIPRTRCALLQTALNRKQRTEPPLYQIDATKCKKCGLCLREFGCPAFTLHGEDVAIVASLCVGCGVCVRVCPFDAISEVPRS